MKVLITGGAGYIGSNTSLIFLDRGHDVTIIDNLVTGYKKLIPKKAHFIESDISDTKKLTNLFKKKKIDVVIHFAAHTKVNESLQFVKNILKIIMKKQKYLLMSVLNKV